MYVFSSFILAHRLKKNVKRYVMFIKVITYSILGSTHFIRIYHVNSVKIQIQRSSKTTKFHLVSTVYHTR